MKEQDLHSVERMVRAAVGLPQPADDDATDLAAQMTERVELTNLAQQSMAALRQLNDIRQNHEVEGRLHELMWDQVEEIADRLLAMSNGLEDTRNRLISAEMELQAAKRSADGAYSERNKLVRFVSSVFPSWLERHPEDDENWDDEWRWIVFVDALAGQLSWHIHDDELDSFSHLEVRTPNDPSWDGHTTEEKYSRLRESGDRLDLWYLAKPLRPREGYKTNIPEPCGKLAEKTLDLAQQAFEAGFMMSETALQTGKGRQEIEDRFNAWLEAKGTD